MNTVTVSPKYQVVIPLEIRRELGLKPGEKLRMIRFQDRVEMVPIRTIKSMRGFLKGIDTQIERESDRI
jgi:AbrB family looped-hinge helix DNA binding protein